MEIASDGHDPVILDLGTGLRSYGDQLAEEQRLDGYRASVLLTHLHWDHIQGLPFFHPLSAGGGTVTVFGPEQADGPLAEVFRGVMSPPYFPITPEQLNGDVAFEAVGNDDFASNGAKVKARWVRHTDPTLGFRVEIEGFSVAYLSDHGPGTVPDDPDLYVPDSVLELCDGADLVIHDAQHTDVEYEHKRHWGHCTVDYAIHVAREAGARELALFHHCPSHGDDKMDTILRDARDNVARLGGPEIFAAADGLTVELGHLTSNDG
ncbi:MAG TPA: MBL fold metallo-hydrolase [Acidimicrobiia bacterium]|nr:MBL fold metallo-hydrolase [Acidimicrobiia bacterium]